MTMPVPAGPESDLHASIRKAFAIMAKGAPDVAESMLKIATEGKSEIARVQAAQVIFDRIGLHGRMDVGVTATTLFGVVDTANGGEAVNTVKKRLESLRQQALSPVEDSGSNVLPFPTLVTGEVVEVEDDD